MTLTETRGPHPSEDELVLYHYGESDDPESVESHLSACAGCRAGYEGLKRALAVIESVPVPEPDERFEDRMWERVQPRLAAPARPVWWMLFTPARLALAGGVAVLVIAAFVAGRNWPRPEPAAPAATTATTAGAIGRDRVLLFAVVDHLDRSERALTELVNTEPGRTVDISSEQGLVRQLVPANRLIRQTASEFGEAGMAGLLDDLERVLVEIAHSPSTMSSDEFKEIRQRIESQGIIFKVRVLGSDVRDRQVAAARAQARQRS